MAMRSYMQPPHHEAAEETAESPTSLPKGKIAGFLGVALALALAASSAVLWRSTGSRTGSLRNSQLKDTLERREEKLVASEGSHGGSACLIDKDTEYWDRNLDVRHNLNSAESCRDACGEDKRCGAWTWGQDAGAHMVCWLKELAEGGEPYRHEMPGVVSGMPCRKGSAAQTSNATAGAKTSKSTNSTGSAQTSKATASAKTANNTNSTNNSNASARSNSSEQGLPNETHKEVMTQRKVVVPVEAKEQDTKEEKEKLENASQAKEDKNKSDPVAGISTLLSVRRGCHEIEDDMDYWNKNLYAEPSVTSAEICQLRCQWEPACGAWTWGKQRHTEGLTDVCFLKTLDESEVPTRHPKKGVVSGIPCAEQEKESQSLFCWALMQPDSYEKELLREQYRKKVSLFACESYAVYSNSSIEIDKELTTSVVPVSLQSKIGGEFMTALNTDVFLAVWKQVISEGKFQESSWTLKVDPDCVFFPDRLALTLRRYPEMDKGVYINNCKYGLHGPLEIFSRNAVRSWAEGAASCVRHFHDKCHGPCAWGEDLFIDQCLWKVLDVQRVDNWRILQEDHCDPPEGWESCNDTSFTAFHPFKTSESWFGCFENSSMASKAESEKPSQLINFKK